MIRHHPRFLKTIWPLILIGWGVCLYTASLRGDFQFDDHPVIVHNPQLRAAGPVELWREVAHPTRYVAYLTFWANYQVGRLDPFGYRVVNLFIHLINTLLVYAFVLLLCGTPRGREAAGGLAPPLLAATGAALFLCHPLNTQAVSYITQRFTSLASMFYLLAVCAYLCGRMASGRKAAGWWIAAAGSAVAGMFTKQITLTLPVMILLLEFSLFPRRSGRGTAVLIFLALGLGAVIPALYQFRAADIFSITHTNGNHPGDIVNAGTYALTQPRVIVSYLRLWLWPGGQTLLHDFPLSTGWGDPRLAASAAVIAGIMGAGCVNWSRARLVSLGIFWFFIALAVESSFIPIRHVIFEHRAYLPSVGLCVAAAWLIHQTVRPRAARGAVIAVLIGALSFLTVQRNRVWQSGVALWTDVVSKTPNNARAHYNLGYEYLKDGDTDAALDHFSKAVLIDPDYELAYMNRSQILLDEGQVDMALHDINKVIRLNDRRAGAYLNRGVIYRQAGRFGEALADFETAQRLDPDLRAAVINRALTLGNVGRYAEGLRVLRGVDNDAPADAKIWAARGALQMGLQDLTEAEQSFSRGIAIAPDLTELYVNRAQVYQALGRYERAEADLSVLIGRGGGNADLFLQRAYVRTRLHRLGEALDDYAAVARFRPELGKVYLERGKIFYRLGQYREAADALDQYLTRTPNAPQAIMLRGLSRYELREFSQALTDFTRARELGYDVDEDYFRRTREAMGNI